MAEKDRIARAWNGPYLQPTWQQLTLAEIEQRLRAEGWDELTIAKTLAYISDARAALRASIQQRRWPIS